MTRFRTNFEIENFTDKISHNSNIFLIGSCFTENISQKLIEYKFRTEVNPFGILYNPASIINSLNFLLESKSFKEADLFHANNLWSSYYHHSRFSDSDQSKCLEKINSAILNAHQSLKNSSFLFITFGTARVYCIKSSGMIVSNCHKQASGLFDTFLLNYKDIVKEYSLLIKKLKKINPSVNIVFTLSPVRHWQDGAVYNQLSKAVLMMAINELVNSIEKTSYFPAYEIMMDDLRDYRFYKEDMIHPNNIAIDYIWEKFSNVLISEESKKLFNDIDAINKAFSHKASHPESPDYKLFQSKTMDKINIILEKYPGLDFGKEMN